MRELRQLLIAAGAVAAALLVWSFTMEALGLEQWAPLPTRTLVGTLWSQAPSASPVARAARRGSVATGPAGRRCACVSDDISYMRRAILIARSADADAGAVAIGCVIVRDGAILAEAHNETGPRHDPTAHAEMVAIRRACAGLAAQDLRGATLYCTMQPCGMCSMAAIWAKIGRVVYGAGRGDVYQMYFESRHLNAMDFISDAFRDDVSLTGGVLRAECAALYVGPDEDVPTHEQVNL